MMQTTEVIWHNGEFIPWADAKIHVLSHTLHYGGGAFEGIRFYKAPKGPAIFRLNDHVERFFYSMAVLKMNLPYSKEEVTTAITAVVSKNKLDSGYIRPLAFYGYGKMGVNPVGNPVDLIIACWPWGAYHPHESIDVKTSSYIRIHPESTVVDAKICGHYVNSILASLELQGTHYHEALLLDSSGYIAEGVGENFFMVKDGVIYTPTLGKILSGITRDTVIKLARTLSFSVIETDISLYDAYQADEAFFTGTAAEITPIRSINDKRLGKNDVGTVTAVIKKGYMDLVQGLSDDVMHYLTYV
ncbi:branched-chain amino acid transaminase [Legionella fallonii]|uniref:Branched-chain-amino-acid aminotransferase n=1 Tax=Legionella fallonii LLAP-10 TaxID=1212491 RepID=A0A098G4Q8_9GAMM|nr:branched-chain amino acid transaminase [Legionella fallonii]CEG56979.1 Branched-chain-amino-acid aminotransferase [Legionella fallonii LLAP-10]